MHPEHGVTTTRGYTVIVSLDIHTTAYRMVLFVKKNAQSVLDVINTSTDHLTAEQIFITQQNAGKKMALLFIDLLSLFKLANVLNSQ